MIKRGGLIVVGVMCFSTVFAQTSKELRPLNEFSFSLFGELRKENQNVFFSPLSAYLSLGMLSDGAAGTNKAQIDSVLGLGKKIGIYQVRSGIDEMMSHYVGNGKIQLANGCWVDQSIVLKKDFLKAFLNQPLSSIETVDMSDPASVVESVNAWADDVTKGTIPNLISASAIAPQTKMLLCNSLYMNLPWERGFKPRSTYVHEFTDANKMKSNLKFMYKMGYMEYAYEKKYHLVVRTLGKGNQAFCIVIPKEGYSLDEVEGQFTSKKLSQMLRRTYDQRVRLSLPKFTMEGEYDFKQPLKNMGLKEMFTNAPDFSMMTDDNLMVDAISQKVKIDVNEKRIVAAAVTVIRGDTGSAAGMPDPDIPVDFVADRPFLFFIIDKSTNGIYFMGRYTVPNEKDIVMNEE
ncbi:MAG: serpin family protein [Flavobacteriales bacterium]|nr:serpin family protein [Flavobacteriales bacterium]